MLTRKRYRATTTHAGSSTLRLGLASPCEPFGGASRSLLAFLPFAFLVVLVAIVGTSAAIVEGAKAVPRDGAGSILFASDRRATTGGFNIYRMDADGRGPMRRLTEAPGDRVMPAVSPDGEKIAFASDSSGDGEIWRMRADGTDPTKLTHSPNSEDLQPAWQPLP